ncbi:YceI family protein [Streptomyces sp. NPDC048324]|uniref:YceI family protein n=1 Tax=Streptomyces sp. NPDC048324 TaxID=3157205 RepID=UPI0034450DE0
MKPLTDADRAEIKRALEGRTLLDTAEHPTITFRSTRIEGNAESFEITGDLVIKGRTHSVPVRRSGMPGSADHQRLLTSAGPRRFAGCWAVRVARSAPRRCGGRWVWQEARHGALGVRVLGLPRRGRSPADRGRG